VKGSGTASKKISKKKRDPEGRRIMLGLATSGGFQRATKEEKAEEGGGPPYEGYEKGYQESKPRHSPGEKKKKKSSLQGKRTGCRKSMRIKLEGKRNFAQAQGGVTKSERSAGGDPKNGWL